MSQEFNITPKDLLYSQKEIGAHINNSVIAQKQFFNTADTAHATFVRSYAEALIEPCIDAVDEGALTAQEACYIFSSAAALIWAKFIGKKFKLPAQEDVEEILGKKKK